MYDRTVDMYQAAYREIREYGSLFQPSTIVPFNLATTRYSDARLREHIADAIQASEIVKTVTELLERIETEKNRIDELRLEKGHDSWFLINSSRQSADNVRLSNDSDGPTGYQLV